jgi:hypothetical protein
LINNQGIRVSKKVKGKLKRLKVSNEKGVWERGERFNRKLVKTK